MVVPILFRKGGGPTPSYDFLDFASGAGYKKFYGGRVYGVGYFLTTNPIESNTGATTAFSGVFTAALDGADIDADFDCTFSVPMRTATADAIVNLTLWEEAGSSINNVTANIYHVRGATETLIGTGSDNSVGVGSAYFRQCIKVPLTTKSFAIGDILRLNIVVTNTEGVGDDMNLYHDPSSTLTYTDKVGRTVGTDLIVMMPFKLNI